MIEETLKRGIIVVVEKIEDEMEEVLKNIFDINTEATTTREISVKIKVKPLDNRKGCTYTIESSNKLASKRSFSGQAVIGMGIDGKVEIFGNDPDQRDFFINNEKVEHQTEGVN